MGHALGGRCFGGIGHVLLPARTPRLQPVDSEPGRQLRVDPRQLFVRTPVHDPNRGTGGRPAPLHAAFRRYLGSFGREGGQVADSAHPVIETDEQRRPGDAGPALAAEQLQAELRRRGLPGTRAGDGRVYGPGRAGWQRAGKELMITSLRSDMSI